MEESSSSEKMGKLSPTNKKKKERWLLTRKTWRYMADAGRRLIPEGHPIRGPEDIPKIEAYFQEVCTKEPKFLIWRKQSYPGALGFRRGRRRKKGGSYREKTWSADEAEDIKKDRERPSTSSSRSDLPRMKEEFLLGTGPKVDDELIGTLQNYLYGSLDMQVLFDKLKEQFDHISSRTRPVIMTPHRVDTSLLEILRRYYSKSTNREKVLSDLLTDRKKLERLYFELRKAKGFSVRLRGRLAESEEEEDTGESSTAPNSPIVIEPEKITTLGTQTMMILPQSWTLIQEEVKKVKAKEAEAEEKEAKAAAAGRRSSVDNDDVSPSVSDTIKRYLRMARKKSVDSDKADRFKRVNYDRNLRNIKGKGVPSISEDDGTDKSAQTDETWIVALRDLKIETSEVEYPSSRSSLTEGTTSPTSPTSKSFLSSGQTFLTNLLHGFQEKTSANVTGGGGTMHKSKSSTSVVAGTRLVSKKIWKSRSKSQSRATPSATSAWTPQGRCVWSNLSGRSITLTDTTLQQLSEIERRILQKVALAKLQALNLGVTVKIPSETPQPSTVQKQKRKAYLIKRKAITTGFFDSNYKDKGSSSESCVGSGSGSVFGVALHECVENERAKANQHPANESILDLRRKSHHGSRGSFSSLIEPRTDERGSCESLICPTLSMTGLDNLSCGSANNLCPTTSEPPRIPHLVSSCLNHLESHALNTLGIFRVSSSKKRVRQLREDFDCGKDINLEDEVSPHDVATLLKEYFRDLPDPLLCKDLYSPFVQTQRIRNRKLQHEALQHLVQLLPVANRDTLYSLLHFLALVAINCDDHKNAEGEWTPGNKMDSSNLATLFAPNILHPCLKRTAKEEMSQERIEERSDSINVIRCLIDNYKSLFLVSAELLDEVYVHMMDSHPEMLDQIMSKKDVYSGDEQEDSNVESNVDEDRKYWSRESCTHETAAMGGPDLAMRPRKLERGRERSLKKRRDDLVRKRSVGGSGGESADSSRRPSDEKRVSSSDSGHLSPQENPNDGVITASLKIPVPAVTSFSLNLDDIPYIEDNDRQQITLGLLKCGGVTTSESGVGSFSPPTRAPSVTSWGSTSPETEPTLASLSFPTRQEALKVTISTTPQVHQVHSGFNRSEMQTGRLSSYSRLLSVDRISKSASSTSMSGSTPVPTSISNIGGAVLRSKTADIERMLRLSGSSSSSSVTSDYRRRHGRSREETRVESQSTSRSESRGGFWKRREIISSEPKERRNVY